MFNYCPIFAKIDSYCKHPSCIEKLLNVSLLRYHQFHQKKISYCELYLKHCNPHCESDRSVKNVKHDLNGVAMDLDSVQKKTESTVSDRCCIYFQSRTSRTG